MAELKDSIEDLIEESYLMGRSEAEIKTDLDIFINACEKVIREHVREKEKLEDLAEKLALARTCNLVSDLSDSEDRRKEAQNKIPSERFAEKVARNKRIILKAIGDCDASLVAYIEQERFHGVIEEPKRPGVKIRTQKGLSKEAQGLLLKVSYGVTIVFIFFLIYLVMF